MAGESKFWYNGLDFYFLDNENGETHWLDGLPLEGLDAVDIEIAGTLAGVGTLAGALTVSLPLSGTLAGVGTLTGLALIPLPSSSLAGVGTLTGNLFVALTLSGSLAGVGTLTGTLTASSGQGRPTATFVRYRNAVGRALAGPMPIAYITRINRYTITTTPDYMAIEQQFDPGYQGDPGTDVRLP